MLRTFYLFTLLLLPVACTHKAQAPTEQPPLMAGEARFAPISSTQQSELQQLLAPYLQPGATVELWYSANTERDNGTFEWCISPAPSEAVWVNLGTMPQAELEKLVHENTITEYGDTLDYWLRFELRCGDKRLPLSLCPSEEFGVNLDGCSVSVRSRSFHRAVWQLMDSRYNIQKRFDKIVLE